MSNGKAMIVYLIVGLIKKILLYKMRHFPEPYDHIKIKLKVKLNQFSYATKSDLKKATGVDASKLAKIKCR